MVAYADDSDVNTPETLETRPAITCLEYIENYLLGTDYADYASNLEKEFYDSPEDYLCPDYDEVTIYGAFKRGQAFEARLYLKDEYQQGLKDGSMASADVETKMLDTKAIMMFLTQFFTPSSYYEHGMTQYIVRKRYMA